MSGSTPCVRGEERNPHSRADDRRFTPARTGKRALRPGSSSAESVHPRAYGEKPLVVCRSRQCIGSTPCVRGMGLRRAAAPRACTVHPRAYGEEAACSNVSGSMTGSPPYVRGRGGNARGGRVADRFTPVRTGTSLGRPWIGAMRTVHPRAYGEETNAIAA